MNKRAYLTAVAAAALVALLMEAPSARADGPGASNTVAPHYYLALGDSLADGFQPNADYGHGYPDQLYAALKAKDPTLQQVNLSCGGEGAATMINGGVRWAGRGASYQCDYPTGSQLAEAVAFLRGHRSFVSLVTIDIGAADVSSCWVVLDFSSGCAGRYLPTLAANLSTILGQLREAAGPNVPIVGMNYYDPFLGLWVLGMPAAATASESFVRQFNETLQNTYHTAGDPVADVETAFAVTDFSHTATLPGAGTVPLNVYNTCTLTWFCTAQDIHANTAGYSLIAKAFTDALP